MSGLDLAGIVEAQRRELDAAWEDRSRRPRLVPGEEVVAAVFGHFGTAYAKPRDTERIARLMRPDEIATEIKDLIRRAVDLPGSA